MVYVRMLILYWGLNIVQILPTFTNDSKGKARTRASRVCPCLTAQLLPQKYTCLKGRGVPQVFLPYSITFQNTHSLSTFDLGRSHPGEGLGAVSVHSSYAPSSLRRIPIRLISLKLVCRVKPRVTDHALTSDQLSSVTLWDFSLPLPLPKQKYEDLMKLLKLLFLFFRVTSQRGLQSTLQLAWSTSGNMKSLYNCFSIAFREGHLKISFALQTLESMCFSIKYTSQVNFLLHGLSTMPQSDQQRASRGEM